jgi:hypothetical protein
MKLNQLREFVKQIVREEQDYQQLFKHMLDKTGKDINSMSDDEKKKFFNAVDTAYKAKSEGRLAGYNESVNESAEILKPGTKVKLRGGKTGKVVRYDGKMGSPFYIVDIGQYYSIEVPADQIKTESVKEAELTAGQKKIDVDGDGEIEGSDLAKLRANKDESINEEEIKWNAVENAIINFLKMNTKILDKRVKDRDTDGVKGGLQSIIDGLTNAQRSLKLK